MTTTVEVLAAAFKEAGTPFIVGHPGGESVELMEAARQRNMRFLLMKQEVGAMLAATWGDLTGSPGICLSTRGPGAANMVNGVAHAFLDRSPLIAITDTYSRPTYETGLRQRINQQAIYEPVVKWSTVIDAKTVRLQVRRAMRTATAAQAQCISNFRRARRRARPATTSSTRRCCRTGSRRRRTVTISSPRWTCSTAPSGQF
jgi:acetolactate synthase-1/2/3 large subunit